MTFSVLFRSGTLYHLRNDPQNETSPIKSNRIERMSVQNSAYKPLMLVFSTPQNECASTVHESQLLKHV
jgi:hypothetical protein